jgi:FkbM family methyltransferase
MQSFVRKLKARVRQILHRAEDGAQAAGLNTGHSITNFELNRVLAIGGKTYQMRGDNYLADMPDDYEPALCKLLKSASARAGEGIAMDIGANIGATSIFLASLRPEVLAFEASPRTRKILEENITNNQIRNIHIFPYGLGECDGELLITAAPDNASGGFISATIQHLDGHITEAATIKNGDSLLQESCPNKRIALIKIDVEGHELEVLSGLSNRLKRDNPVIVLEMNHWCLNAFKRCSIPEFLERLQSIFPSILAFDDGSEKSLMIGASRPSETYHVMHEHIVNNKYPTLVMAPNPQLLEAIASDLTAC